LNDLLTQGLASGNPISFLSQGLIEDLFAVTFIVKYLAIVLNFQTSAIAIAVADSSLEILSTFNNIALDVANNKIGVEVLKQSAIEVDVLKQSEIILNAIDSYPTT